LAKATKAVSLGVVSLVAIVVILVVGFGVFLSTMNSNIFTTSVTITVKTTVTSTISQTSSVKTSNSTTSGISTTSTQSRGLLVRLELNSTRIVSGAILEINASDYNPSPMVLNLSKEAAWAVDGLSTGGCPSLYLPLGIAVLQGRYASTNVSQAVALRIFPLVACPMLVRYITGYLFQPMSDNATVLPGTGETPMMAVVSVSGTYNTVGNQLNQLTPFSPGTYTVVAGDEWGNLVFAYFTVVTS
jgi:hypothetical protein